MPRKFNSEISWTNVLVSDLPTEIQALVEAKRKAMEADKTATEALRNAMVTLARANGALKANETFKLSTYYINRDNPTIGYAVEAEKAKAKPSGLVISQATAFAKLYNADKTAKAETNALPSAFDRRKKPASTGA